LRAIPSPHLCCAIAIPLLYCVVALRSRCRHQELNSDVACSASASSFFADTACSPSSLQLPSPTPCRHHVLACPCVPFGRIDSPPCLAHLLASGVWTNALYVTSTQGRCHCDLMHARARSLCCRTEPSSLSLSPCIGPRCPHAMRGYKRDLPRAFCLCLWFHRPSVPEHSTTSEQLLEAWPTSPTTSQQLLEAWPTTSNQLPEAWLTSPTTSNQLPKAWPTYPITSEQLPEVWSEHLITSGPLPEAWPTSPTTGAARHRRHAPVSSTPSVARLPCFELELSTKSGRFAMRLGCSQ
jgi:hypothetical protein